MSKLIKLLFLMMLLSGCNYERPRKLIVINNNFIMVRIKEISYIKEIHEKSPKFKNDEFNICLYRSSLHNATTIANDINLLYDNSNDKDINKPIAKAINSKTIKIKIPLKYIKQDEVLDFIEGIERIPLTDPDLYITNKKMVEKEALLIKK